MDTVESIVVIVSGAGGVVLLGFGRREGYMLGLMGAPYWAMLTWSAPVAYFATTLVIAFANAVGVARTYLLPWWRSRGGRRGAGVLLTIQLPPGRALD